VDLPSPVSDLATICVESSNSLVRYNSLTTVSSDFFVTESILWKNVQKSISATQVPMNCTNWAYSAPWSPWLVLKGLFCKRSEDGWKRTRGRWVPLHPWTSRRYTNYIIIIIVIRGKDPVPYSMQFHHHYLAFSIFLYSPQAWCNPQLCPREIRGNSLCKAFLVTQWTIILYNLITKQNRINGTAIAQWNNEYFSTFSAYVFTLDLLVRVQHNLGRTASLQPKVIAKIYTFDKW